MSNYCSAALCHGYLNSFSGWLQYYILVSYSYGTVVMINNKLQFAKINRNPYLTLILTTKNCKKLAQNTWVYEFWKNVFVGFLIALYQSRKYCCYYFVIYYLCYYERNDQALQSQ